MASTTPQGWESLFRAVFASSENAMCLLDTERRIVQVNRAAEELFGYSRKDVVGVRIDDFMAPGELPEAISRWEESLEAGQWAGEREMRRSTGEHLRVEFAANAELVTGRRLILYVARAAELRQQRPPSARPEAPLSRRECEIVGMVALGRTSREVADELFISPETVRTHVRSAMAKLGAGTRAQLVAKALGRGLIFEGD